MNLSFMNGDFASFRQYPIRFQNNIQYWNNQNNISNVTNNNDASHNNNNNNNTQYKQISNVPNNNNDNNNNNNNNTQYKHISNVTNNNATYNNNTPISNVTNNNNNDILDLVSTTSEITANPYDCTPDKFIGTSKKIAR